MHWFLFFFWGGGVGGGGVCQREIGTLKNEGEIQLNLEKKKN